MLIYLVCMELIMLKFGIYSIRVGGWLEVVEELQSEGKIRFFIGLSTDGPTDLIIQGINTNKFDYVNLHWCYINQWNLSAIEAAKKLDMGVFIISPSNKGGLLYQLSEKLFNLCSPLSTMVFNDLFCLSHPQVHTSSIGAAKPSDFDEQLKTLNLLDKSEEILQPILKILENVAIEILGEPWLKTWEQKLPTWEKTPGKINICVILWLLDLALAYDMMEYGKMRYYLLGNGNS